MFELKIKGTIWTELSPTDLWNYYSQEIGVYRGGGNSSSSRLAKPNNLKPRHVMIIHDKNLNEDVIIPNPTKGLSFSGSIARLEGKRPPAPKISGHIWLLPSGSLLPEGLVFNVKSKDHPLLNVSRRMTVKEFLSKLKELEKLMIKSDNKRIK